MKEFNDLTDLYIYNYKFLKVAPRFESEVSKINLNTFFQLLLLYLSTFLKN